MRGRRAAGSGTLRPAAAAADAWAMFRWSVRSCFRFPYGRRKVLSAIPRPLTLPAIRTGSSGRINMRDYSSRACGPSLSRFGTASLSVGNCLFRRAGPTSKRTASHSTGAICHSSISRGVAPFSNSEGFVSAMLRYVPALSGSCMYRTLRAARWAVLVLPHHFAPSISTAPAALSSRCSTLSDMRCR